MKLILKSLLLTTTAGLATAGLLGGARVRALWTQTQQQVLSLVDDQIDARTALESQLGDLQQRLPRELQDLRGELAQVLAESQDLVQRSEIARRVVQLAAQDRAELEAQVAAGEALALSVSRPASTLQAGERRRTAERLVQVRSTESMYAAQVDQIELQLEVLEAQRDHLVEVIQDREAEYVEFLERVRTLHAEVDAIERNERLIEWMQERESVKTRTSKLEAGSLDELLRNFAQVRSEQADTLAGLSQQARQRDYERIARREAGAFPTPSAGR